jgi:hypothetical protein
METSTFSKLILMPVSLAFGLCALLAVAAAGLTGAALAKASGLDADALSYAAVCLATLPAVAALVLVEGRLELVRERIDRAVWRWRARHRPQVH